MHPRKLLRDKVVALLLNETDAGANVFPSRVRPVEEQILPAILVYANSEEVTNWQEAPREYQRRLSLVIEVVAKANDALEDTLDTIAEQVEDVLRQDHTLGELCGDVILTASDLSIAENGDTLIGSCKLSYDILYYTLAVADETVDNEFADLEQMNIKYHKTDTPQGQQDDAEDELDLT